MKVTVPKMSNKEKRKVTSEIMRYAKRDLQIMVYSIILWQLHKQLGFGVSRLSRFLNELDNNLNEDMEWYAMHEDSDVAFLSAYHLKEATGIDVVKMLGGYKHEFI